MTINFSVSFLYWNRLSPKDAKHALMLGRGALSQPDLALAIHANLALQPYQVMVWSEVLELVEEYFLNSDSTMPAHTGNRTKQWLAYLLRQYSGARPFFHQLKRSRDRQEIAKLFTLARRNAEAQLKWAS